MFFALVCLLARNHVSATESDFNYQHNLVVQASYTQAEVYRITNGSFESQIKEQINFLDKKRNDMIKVMSNMPELLSKPEYIRSIAYQDVVELFANAYLYEKLDFLENIEKMNLIEIAGSISFLIRKTLWFLRNEFYITEYFTFSKLLDCKLINPWICKTDRYSISTILFKAVETLEYDRMPPNIGLLDLTVDNIRRGLIRNLFIGCNLDLSVNSIILDYSLLALRTHKILSLQYQFHVFKDDLRHLLQILHHTKFVDWFYVPIVLIGNIILVDNSLLIGFEILIHVILSDYKIDLITRTGQAVDKNNFIYHKNFAKNLFKILERFVNTQFYDNSLYSVLLLHIINIYNGLGIFLLDRADIIEACELRANETSCKKLLGLIAIKLQQCS